MTYNSRKRLLTIRALLVSALLSACTRPSAPADPEAAAKIHDLATRYTAAWCSQHAVSVAAFFSPGGSLTINRGTPAVGRDAITAAAQDFMTSFPDLQVLMDSVIVQGNDRAVYHWTLVGTNTGSGGTGRAVRISGFEEWRIDDDWLIAEAQGHFDSEEYQRQLRPAP